MRKPATIQARYLKRTRNEEANRMKKSGVHFLKDHPEGNTFKVHGIFGQFGTLVKINPGSCKVLWEGERIPQLVSPKTEVVSS